MTTTPTKDTTLKEETLGQGNPGSKCKHEPNIICDRTDCTTCIQEEQSKAEKWIQRHSTTHKEHAK